VSHSAAEQQLTNGQHYPRSPHEVQLDAIERLQTQISQNSGALTVHGQDIQHFAEKAKQQEESLRREFQSSLHHQNLEIRRIDDAVGRLSHEMRGIRDLLETLSRDVHAVRSAGPGLPGQSVSAQDSALELMAAQMSNVSVKANEVDTLKITIEIMKNKIQRLEEAASIGGQPAPSQHVTHTFSSPRELSAPSAHSSHTLPAYNSPNAVPHINTPVHPSQKLASFGSHSTQSAVTPDVSQRAEPLQSGWVSVNANA
jgi:hypothetical protein